MAGSLQGLEQGSISAQHLWAHAARPNLTPSLPYMLRAQPGPLGVLADVAAGFERDAEWDAAPVKAAAAGCAAAKGSICLHEC